VAKRRRKSGLPATILEAEAVTFARAEIAWFQDNPIYLLGIDVKLLDKGDNRRFTVHFLKLFALKHPLCMMRLAEYAREGWDPADEALRELIIEFMDRGEKLPTYLAAYNMELAAGGLRRLPGPTKADRFCRDLAMMMVVIKIGKEFGFKPTRNRASKRPSACSIFALAFSTSEATINAMWHSFGRYL
jgi:hypothetical protein